MLYITAAVSVLSYSLASLYPPFLFLLLFSLSLGPQGKGGNKRSFPSFYFLFSLPRIQLTSQISPCFITHLQVSFFLSFPFWVVKFIEGVFTYKLSSFGILVHFFFCQVLLFSGASYVCFFRKFLEPSSDLTGGFRFN